MSRRGLSAGIFTASLLVASAMAPPDLGYAQQPPSEPQTDTSVIAKDGSAHITRVVPVPLTISAQAQRRLATPLVEARRHRTLTQIRADADAVQAAAGDAFQRSALGQVRSASIGGVPVKIIMPAGAPAARSGRILINLHGGGGTQDTGSLTESLPLAARSRTEVVSVLYRLAPEHPFPAAVDDALAVYRAVLRTHRPDQVGVFGSSSGAVLTTEFAVRLKALGLPMPAALGVFSTTGDFSLNGDSQALFTQTGLSGRLSLPEPPQVGGDYAGNVDLKDPMLSPVYADLRGLPPPLFVTSTRAMLLSGTTILHRAFLRAGVDARLVVFEALPHEFWDDPTLPETDEAIGLMAKFFDERLK